MSSNSSSHTVKPIKFSFGSDAVPCELKFLNSQNNQHCEPPLLKIGLHKSLYCGFTVGLQSMSLYYLV
jgi:hypothetical protein